MEVRQAGLRFLNVCGLKIQSFFQKEGAASRNDLESFIEKVSEIEKVFEQLVSGDRQWVEKIGRRSFQCKHF